ncbi:serine hydrolase [Pelomonas sp. Root662]|uniref:serine hydrolase domain-containing protein n=1 Tax=Pelomonas sp. Root662 TaxID=1736580 RepID=UPI0006F651B1|nr:serine hydrolase domain-containing protein [Pelomonas sp. Root662]KQW44883.1 hypothetical protein ASC81_15065 [Pelomonas sp. Root405]KRA70242.1 hypothetical protein ASD88_19225 [Pelomonas sp. Root662]
MRRRTLVGLLTLPTVTALAHNTPLDRALAALVDDPQQPLASLSVLVRRHSRVVFEGQFGRRRIAPDLPVTRDTLFRIASVTKLVVAVAAMRLVQGGRFDLDADVGDLLGYPLHQPLTPRLLLCHRSGLSDGGDDFTDPRVNLRRLLGQPGPTWNGRLPGRWFEYANINFAVLAAAMERATGTRFDQLMQDEVLGPLGMQGGFDPARLPPGQLGQVATLYRKAPSEGGPWWPSGPWHAQADDFYAAPPQRLLADGAAYEPGSRGGLYGPQGRLRTRVCDLGVLMGMLMDGGRVGGERFLSEASVRTLMTESWRADGRNGDEAGGIFQAWGVGLQHFIDRSRPGWGDRLVPGGGVRAWGHLGFAYGLVSALLMAPRRGCGIVYVVGGTGADPATHPGRRSSFPVWEERLQALLWAEALRA